MSLGYLFRLRNLERLTVSKMGQGRGKLRQKPELCPAMVEVIMRAQSGFYWES